MHKNEKTKRKSSLQKELFLVEGLSALSEYLRISPAALEVICYKGQDLPKELAGSASQLPCRHMSVSNWLKEKGAVPSRAPVWGYVRISIGDEPSLYASINPPSTSSLIIALDHIHDPRNLGAIARTAAFFGVRHIVVPSQRQVLLTDVSVATAQGAFSCTNLYCVTNLNRALRKLKEHSYWVLGAEMGGVSYRNQNLADYKHVVLVLGSEGAGLSAQTRKTCDLTVAIPASGNSIESLNVSVAAGILMSQFS